MSTWRVDVPNAEPEFFVTEAFARARERMLRMAGVTWVVCWFDEESGMDG